MTHPRPADGRIDRSATDDRTQPLGDMELLRLATCGKRRRRQVHAHRAAALRLEADLRGPARSRVEASSEQTGAEYTNLALLTDGLRAEREQGITIDVAYRYFATPRRKFIIADTPGHVQYTRNMVTGASTADVAIILIDARNGVIEQTRRHTFIASLLGIPHLVVAVNKMDLVDYCEERLRRDQGRVPRLRREARCR
ncbi:MAG: GTP-binding protein [Microthrixaceae bacterium]